jgi:tight adherence protein C
MMLAVSLGIGLGIIIALLGILAQGREERVGQRLRQYGPTMSLEQVELRLPWTERIFIPVLRRLATALYRLTPTSQIATTRRYLVMAGQSGGVAVIEFIMRRIIVAVALSVAGVLVLGWSRQPPMVTTLLVIVLGLLGYMLPSVWLGSRVRARQETIQRTLPDALDLLTVCVQAGAGFDSAIAKVVSRWRGPLADELERLLADMRMGRSRKDALRDLGERTGVLDVQAFGSALIQADQLGVGLASVLRIQAEQMRLRRRLRAEEQAQKAPVKMLFPLIFMIFPALYIVILGPAVFSLVRALGGT